MSLFEPSAEVLTKDVDVAETTPDDLEETMGASAYTGDYGRAMELVESTEHEVAELQDLCDRIFRLPRHTRIYVSDEEYGYRYLAPTNVGSLKPWYRQINNTEKGYLSKRSHDISDYRVEEGWILITMSGSVNLGSVFMATDYLSDYFITQDMIRVVAKEDVLEGYLYAYLDSWIGRTLMLHNRYGIGVDHIRPPQIEDMPVVLPPRNIRKEIHDEILDAYESRDKQLKMNKGAVEGLGEKFESMLGDFPL